jgi:hypothetical protein
MHEVYSTTITLHTLLLLLIHQINCTRCEKLKKQCVFFEIPKDPVTESVIPFQPPFPSTGEK